MSEETPLGRMIGEAMKRLAEGRASEPKPRALQITEEEAEFKCGHGIDGRSGDPKTPRPADAKGEPC